MHPWQYPDCRPWFFKVTVVMYQFSNIERTSFIISCFQLSFLEQWFFFSQQLKTEMFIEQIKCINIFILSTKTEMRLERFLLKCLHHTHWENYISITFHIEWDMIVVTIFLSILNQMEWNGKSQRSFFFLKMLELSVKNPRLRSYPTAV